ncbi:MAG TPA: hypothetical protein VG488_13835 [Candidatus Angelobacter sp.]|nr:hypothetical protein [Candidatus Angelobacter sp.]
MVCVAGIVVVGATYYALWVKRHFPTDTTQNGITIGHAKAFDNRSLALRVERLNASLENFRVVSQNVTESLENLQEQTSNKTSLSLSVGLDANAGKTQNSAKSNPGNTEKKETGAPPAVSAIQTEGKPNVGLAASDVLSNQLNLASQIFNLQTLYERSLTDRMIDGDSRLQTVLGFQVSITPPVGYEDCIAVVEIGVRMKAGNDPKPVSLVALMPQEKTYNAESISGSERSIEGSAVAKVLTMDFSGKGESRHLFVHRDSDTIAFEREPSAEPVFFENATTFGWEFRPVLGRQAVSPGTRQMLAVVAVPMADKSDGGQAAECTLEVKTRSYWRRYHRRKQTTGPNWSWSPWKVDRSFVIQSKTQELKIPNTAKIQSALQPHVTGIEWVNSGQGRATVIVEGYNFFSGTKIILGGKTHREEDGTLTLKSDQALEFETSMELLASGDAVLSGRFGPALQLVMPDSKLPFTSLEIIEATVSTTKYSKACRVSIVVRGLNEKGDEEDLFVDNLNQWPDPILFIGTEPVPTPYDYYEPSPAPSYGTETALETGSPPSISSPSGIDSASGTALPPMGSPPGIGSGKQHIRVEAWVAEKMLVENASVTFSVPFCGENYKTLHPLTFSQPKLVRIGGDDNLTRFHISRPSGFGTDLVSVDLDRTYVETPVGPGTGGPSAPGTTSPPTPGTTGAPAPVARLVRLPGTGEFSFTVPTDLVKHYQKMIFRITPPKTTLVNPLLTTPFAKGLRKDQEESYLLPIPPEDKLRAKTSIDASMKPPQVPKGSHGPVEWTGNGLDEIKNVSMNGVNQHFSTYTGGTRLVVCFTEGSTESEGKPTLECVTASGDKLLLPLFIVAKETKPAPASGRPTPGEETPSPKKQGE